MPSETSAMSGTSLKGGDCKAPRSVPKPLVSVVVPTSNRADYLEVTLASLAAQDLDGPYEVIAIDDGSRDRTPAVIEAAGCARCAATSRAARTPRATPACAWRART